MVLVAQLSWLLLLFSLGTAVGSFLNVVSRRLLRGETVTGRSHCESCGHPLSGADLIPLLSFFFLRGRCRYCGVRLSWQYPFVEGGVGILFVSLAWWVFSKLGFNLHSFAAAFFLLVSASSLVVIFVTDLFEQKIFDRVVLIGVGSSLLYRLFVGETILWDFAIAFLVFLFFWILRLVTRGRGMGEGDPPLGFLVALLTGFPNSLVMLFLAFVAGAVVGLFLIVTRRKRFGEQIPFGPFLVAATFITLFLGDFLLDWYLCLLGYNG